MAHLIHYHGWFSKIIFTISIWQCSRTGKIATVALVTLSVIPGYYIYVKMKLSL